MKKFIGKVIAAVAGAVLMFSLTVGVTVEARSPVVYQFEPWDGSGNTSVRINNIDSSRFIKIVKEGKKFIEVDKEAYSITEMNGDTIITLNEDYLKNLNKEADKYFRAYFSGEGIVTNKIWILDLEENQTEITVSKPEGEKVLRVLEYDDKNEVDPSHYTFTDNGNEMTIAFEEEYLQTVPKKDFEIQLSGDIIVFMDLNFDMKGDAIGNYAITINDAKTALRAALNITALSGKQINLLDLDKDGQVTLKDAQKILRVALNIDSI